MSDQSHETVQWYRVEGVELVTSPAVGTSWMLQLTDSLGTSREALWVVKDLPGHTIPAEGAWGLFRLACYDLGLALTVNFVTALLATLSPL